MGTDEKPQAARKIGENIPPVEKRFKLGNPGRPKGSRTKLGEHFIHDLYADWAKHGAKVIARVREEQPAAYLKVTASILPKQVQVENKSDMSDDQLAERLRQLSDFVDFATGRSHGEAGISGSAGGGKAPIRPH